MSDRIYKAALSQSQGREGWSVIFRHPVVLDRATGKPGRRIRRGLGTRDEKEAAKLVGELNQLLADKLFWDSSSRATAVTRFSPIVVDIFYHDIQPESADTFGIRESVIPLPRSADSNYRQVLFLGTTGSGKTTLVRQLMGTKPDTERFPATSTAKTTVADTEIVLAPGQFRAVVTFLPRDQVRDYVEECMAAAVFGAYYGQSDARVLRRLLSHVNQRFRLSYVLGTGDQPGDDDDDTDDGLFKNDAPVDFDQSATRTLLRSAVERIRAIARKQPTALKEEMRSQPVDERVLVELFEESLDSRLREDEAFQTLADELMDEIERRFDLLTTGRVEKTKQSWPRLWSFEAADRDLFLRTVARFSSNYAPYFGTLLTPLVNGVRVAGPFAPTWADKQPPLVLFDVEGLGHTPDSAASLPTALTRRLNDVDAVLIVDNATQPMQAATVAAMRSLASGGLAGKLIVCFTHFDGVVGDNLPTFKSRELLVLASAENALTAIGEQLGAFAERVLRKRLHSTSVFLGGLQQPLTENTKAERRTAEELKRLLRTIDEIAVKPVPVAARPVYDRMDLVLSVKQAAEDFQSAWRARLGLEVKFGGSKEHWALVKALTRRLAEGWDDEYLNLKPIADLHKELRESIYRFIQNPVSWNPAAPRDGAKQQVFDTFAESIGTRLLAIATVRLRDEVRRDWQRAFELSGGGSTFVRARTIWNEVYEKAVPAPNMAPTPDRNKLLHDVIEVVRQAAEENKITLK